MLLGLKRSQRPGRFPIAVRTLDAMTDSNVAAEKAAIAEVLDAYRGVARWKLEGVSRDDAIRRYVASETTLLGVVKHLIYVERFWFQVILGGNPEAIPPWADVPGFDWRFDDDDTVAGIVEQYEAEAAASRKILADLESLDAEFSRRDETMTARAILLHVIEEIARHVGHMDIIRELIDESVGWGPDDA